MVPEGPGDQPVTDQLAPHLAQPLAEIDAELARCADESGRDGSAGLTDAVRYALLGGGKRLRPLLVWHVCAAAGGDPRSSLCAAAAVELVHAFSLVHDDLPAMDDDDLRRGRPTLHIHAGEAMAILAGDAMLAMAFGWIARSDAAPERNVELIRELASGAAGMIAGQVFDTLPEADPPIEAHARLRRIHRCKTGALIRAACRMGARCAAAHPSAVEHAGLYGEALGLMFQAVDDLVDVEQPADRAGKRTGKDHAAGKLTYPGLLGVDATRREIEQLRAQALGHARRVGPDPEPLIDLASYLAGRTR
jgi:geranylgeranyl diphosphate synthase type II